MTEDFREHVRVGSVLEFEFSSDGVAVPARLEDLSEGGAFVDTPNPLSRGAEVDFKLSLPGGDPIVGRAVVVWHQQTVGMGIRFVGLEAEQRERIKFFVASRFFESL